jgi:rhamnosyltransferase
MITPFVRFRFWGIERIPPNESHPLINCDFLISSGLLTSIARFQAVGAWEDALFVDNVDMEWSFRARSRGFHCFGVSTAQLSHSLGEHVFRLKIFRWHLSIYTHPPPRQYYINRNRIALYRRPYVPLTWKVQDVPRGFLKSALICLIFPPRLENLESTFHGILDGLRGRLGARHGDPRQVSGQDPPQSHGHHANDPRNEAPTKQSTSCASQTGSR